MKKAVIVLFILAGLAFTAYSTLADRTDDSYDTPNQSQTHRATPPQKTGESAFDKTTYSLSDPASVWVVVNKQRPLQPKSYTPQDLAVPKVPLRAPKDVSMKLRVVAGQALESMFTDAKKDNIELLLSSGYRPYSYQTGLYNGYVASQGQAVADTQSARPGFSEHQTGLAADIGALNRKCEVEQCFANTPEGKWVAANAYKYGFVVRYPNGQDKITGYEYEPWHLRYIGIPAATEMHNQGIDTLEVFFDTGSAPDY